MSTAEKIPGVTVTIDPEDPSLIKIHARRHDKCWVCNKDGSEEMTIERRLTPVIRTDDGRRYTKESLIEDMLEEVKAWKQTKYVQPKCQKQALDSTLAIIDQLDAEADLLREVQAYAIEHRTEPAFATMINELGLDVETAS